MRVLCLTTLPTLGAGNRLRVEQYAEPLRGLGIELVVSPFFDEATHRVLYRPGETVRKVLGVLRGVWRRARDLSRAGSYDLVLVYREAVPVGPPLFERALRARGVPFVFDFDDAIFVPAPHSVNARWSWLRQPSRVAETAKLAASVIVGNEYLAVHARCWNRDVAIIPTPVDTRRHRPRIRAHDEQLLIGWLGSGTTTPYLRLLDEALAELSARRPFVFRVIGGEYAHPTAKVDLRAYDLETEPDEVARFDIGVLPEPDDAWTRGKGAFKALVYMAAGLPVVASRVGVNPDVVVHGETGFCVTTTAEWVDALETLARDRALRERFGAAGRRRVEERYSLDVQAPRFAAVLRRAVGALH